MQDNSSSICLTDQEGNLHIEAFSNVMVHMYFPGCPDDRAQALLLLAHERGRRERLQDSYTPTRIVRTVINAVNKQQGQHSVTGLVALAMAGLDNAGESMSLNRAAKVVSEYCCENPKIEFWSWTAQEISETQANVLADESNIKKIFRKFRRAAHICAAAVTAADYREPLPMLERAPELEECIIQTCAYYQMRLENNSEALGWNMFDILRARPVSMADTPTLEITNESTRNLFGPFLRAARQD